MQWKPSANWQSTSRIGDKSCQHGEYDGRVGVSSSPEYRFPSKPVRPYVVGGIAWDKISHEPANYSLETKNTTTGLVIGAGLDAHFAVHIMPELRYTHWTSQHFNPAASFILNGNQNQVEVMVGITF